MLIFSGQTNCATSPVCLTFAVIWHVQVVSTEPKYILAVLLQGCAGGGEGVESLKGVSGSFFVSRCHIAGDIWYLMGGIHPLKVTNQLLCCYIIIRSLTGSLTQVSKTLKVEALLLRCPILAGSLRILVFLVCWIGSTAQMSCSEIQGLMTDTLCCLVLHL